MYRNILLPSGYNEFISICVSYISCPSLVLMSRYILAAGLTRPTDGQKENNNGFRFVSLPPHHCQARLNIAHKKVTFFSSLVWNYTTQFYAPHDTRQSLR